VTSKNRWPCAEDQNAELERLNLALDENLEHSVELCLRTMQTFYPTLGNQARRVYELCRALSDGLQLPVEQRRTLEICAWLHDIGLVGVPRQLIKRWETEPASLNRGRTSPHSAAPGFRRGIG
jgi:response regulator RpfG family c-di-GMP phosphodiesterase